MKIYRKISIGTLIFSVLFSVGASAVSGYSSPAMVNLGSAGNFVILSKTGISTTGTTVIVGDIGVSPAAATYITGFGLSLPAASSFATSALVSGKIYAPGYADPTPANLTTAVLDMQNAYTDAMGRAPDVTELGDGNIGWQTLAPGVYKWSSGVTIPADVTLSGGANDVWIFQIAKNLDVSSATQVLLSGGAQAKNIFWVVAGQTTIGTAAIFNGNILDQTAIVLNTYAKLNGRALAQSAVTLDGNIVTTPVSNIAVATPAPTPNPIPGLPLTGSSMSSDSVTAQTSVSGGDNSVLQSHVSSLLAILHSLQAQINQRNIQQNYTPVPAFGSFGQSVRMIARDLEKNSRGDDVMFLQQFLISQNKGMAARALAEVGATAYFGMLTESALAEFQASTGISPATGYFGSKTRNYLRTNN